MTKIVTDTASIRRLARRIGITREVSLRLSLYKTKAQAHRELRKYQVTKARLAAKKKPTGRWKRTKYGWHAKLLKRQQQLLQQDSARAGRGVLLGPILLGHQNSDPFPKSPLFPRDLSRARGALCCRLSGRPRQSSGALASHHPAPIIIVVRRRQLFSAGKFRRNTIAFTFVYRRFKQHAERPSARSLLYNRKICQFVSAENREPQAIAM